MMTSRNIFSDPDTRDQNKWECRVVSDESKRNLLKISGIATVTTPSSEFSLLTKMSAEAMQALIPAMTAAVAKAMERQVTPSMSAIVDDNVVQFNSTREKFDALSTIWRRHNGGKSILNFNHPSYFQIVGLGKSVVPLLLHEVANGAGIWYVALQYITGEQAESREMRGDPKAVRKAWIDWGIKHGYLRD